MKKKIFSLCAVCLSFVQWMNQKREKKEALAETIRRFRKEFYSRKIKQAMRMVQQNYKWDTITRTFNVRAA